MSFLNSFSSPFTDMTDLFCQSELEGFPLDRPYTKTRSSLTANSQRREIGHLGVWTLSSAKAGNGIEQLRDDSLGTYWQSDGNQPHSLTIYFPRKVQASELCLYLDFKNDESYTPSKLSINIGNGPNDLYEVQTVDLEEPLGWYNFSLGFMKNDEFKAIKTHIVQLVILQNQHNGRDTHVRQVKIFGIREDLTIAFPKFSSDVYSKYSFIR